MKRAYSDRVQDIRDSYALRQISRNECIKLLEELYRDYHEAITETNMLDELERNSK